MKRIEIKDQPRRRDSLSAGCDYTVTVYADNSGYAKNCKEMEVV